MAVLGLVWIWYPLTVTAIVAGTTLFATAPGARVLPFVLLHLGLATVASVLLRWTRAVGEGRIRTVWTLFTLGALPTVFSALGMVLPMVHPEPWEWWCIATDRALLGGDPIPKLQETLSPLLVEVLQLAYASFYFLPIAALLGLLAKRSWHHYDRGLVLVAFGFLLSYLGYLLWPTLGPNRLGLWHTDLADLGLAGRVRALIDEAEANHWDCFPSGHTMLSWIAVVIAARGPRPLFWLLLVAAVLVVYATMALCFHYACDVLAGFAGVGIALVLARLMQAPTPRTPSPGAGASASGAPVRSAP